MRTKAPLPEGETWVVYYVELPMLGYGVTLYRAFSCNDHERQKRFNADPFDTDDNDLLGWPQEIEFFSSLDLEMGNRFVIFCSGETLGTIDASALRIGRTELTKPMVTGCSRWQDSWPHWPKS